MPHLRKQVVRRLSEYPPPTPQPTPCRLWQGRATTRGCYGVKHHTKLMHVWVWEQINGPRPPGMCILHRCDNPPCFRYDHLFLGTRGENNRDRHIKGRSRGPSHHAGELNPMAKLSADDVAVIRCRLDGGGIHRQIAVDYGLDQSTVSRIHSGKTWRL